MRKEHQPRDEQRRVSFLGILCKQCICLLLSVLQCPCCKTWLRKSHSLLALLWMSCLSWKFCNTLISALVKQSSCARLQLSELESVRLWCQQRKAECGAEGDGPDPTEHLQLLLLNKLSKSFWRTPRLPASFSAPSICFRRGGQNNAKYTLLWVGNHKHFFTVIWVNIFADQAEKKKKIKFYLLSAKPMHLSTTGFFFEVLVPLCFWGRRFGRRGYLCILQTHYIWKWHIQKMKSCNILAATCQH